MTAAPSAPTTRTATPDLAPPVLRRLYLARFRLRDRRLDGWKFRRQAPVDRYVVDFICADARAIVELDGGQHATSAERDAGRTKVLEAFGYLVLGIAASSDEHVGVLANLAEIIEDPEQAAQFVGATDPALIIERLNRTPVEEA